MMAFQWVTFISIAIIVTIGSCKPYSDVEIQIPEGCEDNEFCNIKPLGYDNHLPSIDEKMEKIQKTWQPKYDQDMFKSRNQYQDTYVNDNCKTDKMMMKPYTYKSNNTIKLVVQSKFYEQKFWTTFCEKPTPDDLDDYEERYMEGDQCMTKMAMSIFKGSCKTKQTIIKIYVYNTDTKQIERVPANIDVCCTCDITMDTSLLRRGRSI